MPLVAVLLRAVTAARGGAPAARLRGPGAAGGEVACDAAPQVVCGDGGIDKAAACTTCRSVPGRAQCRGLCGACWRPEVVRCGSEQWQCRRRLLAQQQAKAVAAAGAAEKQREEEAAAPEPLPPVPDDGDW